MSTLNAPGQGYDSLDELLSVALVNQLGAETAFTKTMPDAASTPTISQIHGTLLRPTGASTAKHLAVPARSTDGLFILTNRLSPLKVATRVLANLSVLVTRLGDDRRWPTIDTFRTTAGHAARALGFALQRHGWPDPSTGRDKRWIGYPVGRDERASLARFAVSFTVSKNDGTAGPLVILGLATVVDAGRIALTEAGWRLAIAPSPLLQESGSGILSDEERIIFAEQIAGASGERAAVTQLLELVVQADGSQTEVDRRLRSFHADWSVNRTTAHRAAIVGRLVELGALSASGRGRRARLRLLADGERFVRDRD